MNVISRMMRDYQSREANKSVSSDSAVFLAKRLTQERGSISQSNFKHIIAGVLAATAVGFATYQINFMSQNALIEKDMIVNVQPQQDIVGEIVKQETEKSKRVESPNSEIATNEVVLANMPIDSVALQSVPPETDHRLETQVKQKPDFSHTQAKVSPIQANKVVPQISHKANRGVTKKEEDRKDQKNVVKHREKKKSIPAIAKKVQRAVPPISDVVVKVEQKQDPLLQKTERKAGSALTSELTKEFVQTTDHERAQMAYIEALSLIEERYLVRAKEALKRALKYNASHLKARENLIAIYLQTRENHAFINSLKIGLEKHPEHFKFRQLLAKVYIEKKLNVQALALLEEAMPKQKASVGYLSLLASIKQNMGRFEEAGDSYQAALEKQPNDAMLWLGLGLAKESGDQFKKAESAYLRARQIGSRSTEIMQYIERRLMAVRLRTDSDS